MFKGERETDRRKRARRSANRSGSEGCQSPLPKKVIGRVAEAARIKMTYAARATSTSRQHQEAWPIVRAGHAEGQVCGAH